MQTRRSSIYHYMKWVIQFSCLLSLRFKTMRVPDCLITIPIITAIDFKASMPQNVDLCQMQPLQYRYPHLSLPYLNRSSTVRRDSAILLVVVQ